MKIEKYLELQNSSLRKNRRSPYLYVMAPVLKELVQDALKNGLSDIRNTEWFELLNEYLDIYCLKLEHAPLSTILPIIFKI